MYHFGRLGQHVTQLEQNTIQADCGYSDMGPPRDHVRWPATRSFLSKLVHLQLSQERVKRKWVERQGRFVGTYGPFFSRRFCVWNVSIAWHWRLSLLVCSLFLWCQIMPTGDLYRSATIFPKRRVPDIGGAKCSLEKSFSIHTYAC